MQAALQNRDIEKCYQILYGICKFNAEENSHNRWILKDFVARFGFHPILQKLLCVSVLSFYYS